MPTKARQPQAHKAHPQPSPCQNRNSQSSRIPGQCRARRKPHHEDRTPNARLCRDARELSRRADGGIKPMRGRADGTHPQCRLGVWRVFDVACALRPAVTVLPLRHFARQNCALGEDAISCTACLAHEGTKPRRSIKRRDFRDGSHRSGASVAGRLSCNSHSVCAPLSRVLIGLTLSAAQRVTGNWFTLG
jgi:hypothetical protein